MDKPKIVVVLDHQPGSLTARILEVLREQGIDRKADPNTPEAIERGELYVAVTRTGRLSSRQPDFQDIPGVVAQVHDSVVIDPETVDLSALEQRMIDYVAGSIADYASADVYAFLYGGPSSLSDSWSSAELERVQRAVDERVLLIDNPEPMMLSARAARRMYAHVERPENEKHRPRDLYNNRRSMNHMAKRGFKGKGKRK